MLLLTRCANRQVTLSVQGVDRKRDEYKGCGGTIHMEKTNEKYGAYIQILREELIPAMGLYRADRGSLCGSCCQTDFRRTAGQGDRGSQRKYHQECKICYCTEYG